MRIVTYARVSTVKQETEGQSLVNQEQAFQSYINSKGAERIAAYAESKSAKSVEGRLEFLRLIQDLPVIRPDLVVVDTIDRFSRNLQDGLNLLERFRGHAVRLLPLDWDEPVDLDDDRDWKNVVQELMAADYERRRIRTRINRSFAGRRERGATTHNRAPFGLRKQGDVLVADDAARDIIKRIDRMFVNGKTRADIVAFVRNCGLPGAWTSMNGLRCCLTNVEYVRAGVRTPRMQARINDRLAADDRQHAHAKHYIHPMTGVFACGWCVRGGQRPEKALLCGTAIPDYARATNFLGDAKLICQRRSEAGHKSVIGMPESYLGIIFADIVLYALCRDDLLDRWSGMPVQAMDARNSAALRMRIATLERSQTYYRKERQRVLRSLPDTGSIGTAKFRLIQIAKSEERLSNIRRSVLEQLEALHRSEQRDVATAYRASLVDLMYQWEYLDAGQANDVARELCRNLGSNPLVYRRSGCYPTEILVTWHELAPSLIWCMRYGKELDGKLEVRHLQPSRDAQGCADLINGRP